MARLRNVGKHAPIVARQQLVTKKKRGVKKKKDNDEKGAKEKTVKATIARKASTTPGPRPALQNSLGSEIQLAGIADAKWLAPSLAEQLHAVPTPHEGTPQKNIDVPMAEGKKVDDTVLFTDPTDSTKKLYVPRYRLESDAAVGGGHRFGIALSTTDEGGALSVRLRRFPAPELEGKLEGAEPIPHRPTVVLRFRFGASTGSAAKELVFDEIVETDQGIDASVALTPAELNQVYGILRDADRRPELVVRRTVDVAVPVDEEEDEAAREGRAAEAAREEASAGTEEATARGRRRRSRGDRTVVRDHRDRDSRKRKPSKRRSRDHRDRGSRRRKPSKRRSRDHRDRISHKRKPSKRRLIRTHIARKKIRIPARRGRSRKEAKEAEKDSDPLFRKTTRSLEARVEPHPFAFEPDLHPYVYEDAKGVSGGRSALIRRQKTFEDTWHSYYQDEAEPNVFYYLPDAFKIARRPEFPHAPFLSVSFGSEDDADDISVRFTCVGAPFVSVARLRAAREMLRAHVPSGSDGEDRRIRLEPLLSGEATLDVRPPASLPDQLAEGVPVDLRTGFRFDLTLTLDQFQGIYDSLFGAGASLLDGAVVVPLGGSDGESERVPFSARLDDLAGPVLDVETVPLPEEVDDADQKVRAKVIQAIESPLSMDGLGLLLERGGRDVEGVAETIQLLDDEDFPVRLEPGEEIRLQARTAEPLPGEGPIELAVVPRGLQVEPDREGIWDTILDPTTPAEYAEEIEVFGLPEWFEDPDSGEPLQVMVVEFQRGSTVRLTSDELEARAEVLRPISDLVLRTVEDESESYRYRVTLVRAGGSTTSDWRAASASILYPEPEA